jgi:predicted PolB exonuclease-like 3'-5' exonuclease
MNTIIFDIETIPKDFDALDEAVQNYLLKNADTEEEKEKTKDQMALWPPTNEIVAIGVLSCETEKGAVYFQSPNKSVEFEEDNMTYRSGTEKEILEMFWGVLAKANKIVTFNGRGFDGPVLMLKSAMLKVKPSKNLMPYRYSAEFHVDLLEQLTFYNATRKFNLDSYCKAFNIESPKSHGVTGHDVKPLFLDGQYEKIARYCAGDLFATRELYMRWREYISMV